MYMIYIDMVFQEVHTKVHVMTLTLELLISLGVWEDGIKISIAGDLWSDTMWPWDYSQLGDENCASYSLSLWS